MSLLVGGSFYLVAFACIAFGSIWLARGKARMFYGINIEGPAARVASILLIAVGVIISCFAYFVLPGLIPADLLEIR